MSSVTVQMSFSSTNSSNGSYTCGACGANHVDERSLEQHRRTAHTDVPALVCPVCGKGFNKKDKLKRHVVTHTGERPFSCGRCGETFGRLEGLKRHTENVHCTSTLLCPVCKTTFDKWQALQNHKSIHMAAGDSDVPYQRYQTDAEPSKRKSVNKPAIQQLSFGGFDDKSGLQAGIEWNQSNNGNGWPDDAERPKKSPGRDRRRRAECQECGLQVSSVYALTRHVESTHLRITPYVCCLCQRGFARRDKLGQHLLRHHPGVFLYTCTECRAQFPRWIECRNHAKSHVFSCNICSFSANTARCLAAHIVRHERPHFVKHEKRHTCDVCGTRFARRYRLVEHTRKHTGERPYACQHCGDAFAVMSKMREHEQMHVEEEADEEEEEEEVKEEVKEEVDRKEKETFKDI